MKDHLVKFIFCQLMHVLCPTISCLWCVRDSFDTSIIMLIEYVRATTLTIYNRLKRSFEMSKKVKFIFVYCSSIHVQSLFFSNFDSFQNHDSVYFMWNAILMTMVILVHLKGMGNTAFRGALPKHSTLLKLRKFSLFSQNNIYGQVWSKHEHEIQVYV